MAEYPTLAAPYSSRKLITTFRGYHRNPKIGDGEFYHMENLTGDLYPLLSVRKPRGTLRQLTAPRALRGKSKLAWVDGTSLFYGEQDLTSYFTDAGFFLSDREDMLPKQLVSMGAYLIVYPDKLYINTENYTDCGSIEARFSTDEGTPVTFTPCTAEGTAYSEPHIGNAAPESPENGSLWLDTAALPHVLKQYSAQSALWAEIPTVYVRIGAEGIGRQFAVYDGVTVGGVAAHETGAYRQLQEINGSKVIYAKDDDYIVVVGVPGVGYVQTEGQVTVSRTMPDLDFITEASNRLWGCRYGMAEGKTVNEIYCCALGDFKNWNRFLGISTDSYVASVGSDGPWTGAVTHLGCPVFFKEHCLHKVYISGEGAHQIVETSAAVAAWQGNHNRPVSGRVDSPQLHMILNVAADKYPTAENRWDTVRYFARSEFRCKCGKYCDGFPAEPNPLLIEQAETVRNHFGAPVYVSSGVRCERHNANVGGAAGSRHKSGKAMDFRVEGQSAKSVLSFVQTLPHIRYAYAIDGSYVHMDVE